MLDIKPNLIIVMTTGSSRTQTLGQKMSDFINVISAYGIFFAIAFSVMILTTIVEMIKKG